MLETYAAWLDATTESDLQAIRGAMEAPSASQAADPRGSYRREGSGPPDALVSPPVPASCHCAVSGARA